MFLKIGNLILNTDHIHSAAVGPDWVVIAIAHPLDGNGHEAGRITFQDDDAKVLRDFFSAQKGTEEDSGVIRQMAS